MSFGKKIELWLSDKTHNNDYVAIASFDYYSMGASAPSSVIVRAASESHAARAAIEAAIHDYYEVKKILPIIPPQPPHIQDRRAGKKPGPRDGLPNFKCFQKLAEEKNELRDPY